MEKEVVDTMFVHAPSRLVDVAGAGLSPQQRRVVELHVRRGAGSAVAGLALGEVLDVHPAHCS